MRLKRITAAGATAVVVAATGLGLASPASAAAGGPNCYGGVGCAGVALNTNCSADEVRIEQVTVPGLGQLVLYKSPVVCNTVWAQLNVDTTSPFPTSYSGLGYDQGYKFVAEIFYEPPTGGPEQFDLSSPWMGPGAGGTVSSPMLPDNASFKACAGAPSDAAGVIAPFDEDPQGIGGLAEQITYPGLSSTPTAEPGGTPPADYSAGACTLWH